MDADALNAVPAVPVAPTTSLNARLGWGAFFGYLCHFMIVIGIESALHFVGPAIDGPFQLYNSLRRIWVGQRGGVDFQFFHGLGIPYLHYLPFRLLGGGFLHSELVRELVSVLAYPLTVIVFLRFFLRDWTRTLAWAAIVMAGSIALRMTSVLVAINSLLGIRSTLPVLLPVALCLRARPSIRTALSGLMLGGAFVLGTEQGLAAALALVIAFGVAAARTRGRARLTNVFEGAVIVAIGVVTLVGTLTAIGGVAGMRAALNYNFRLVPLDQYWYFGSPPNLFLSSWGVIPRMMSVLPRIPASLLIGVLTAIWSVRLLWRDADGPRGRERLGLTVLALYGIISCASLLGTYVNAYIQPLLRSLLLLGAVFFSTWMPKRDLAMGRRLVAGVGQTVVATALATSALMAAVVPAVFATTFKTIPHLVVDHIIRREGPVYGNIWPETIVTSQAILDAHRDSTGKLPVLWSTYAGLLEARNGIFHPSVDYIIHALGPDGRAKYVADFQRIRPTLVQTVSPVYTQYEAWIEDTSWDFYAHLLRNYDIVGSTPWSYFWALRDTAQAAPAPVWSATILPGNDGVQLPKVPNYGRVSPYVLYQVEMDYQTHNPLHSLPIIGGSPRYLVRALDAVQKDPVTLNPYVTRTRFPLVARSGSTPVLQWATYGLIPGARIEVTAVRLSLVRTSPANAQWLVDLIAQQRGEVEMFR